MRRICSVGAQVLVAAFLRCEIEMRNQMRRDASTLNPPNMRLTCLSRLVTSIYFICVTSVRRYRDWNIIRQNKRRAFLPTIQRDFVKFWRFGNHIISLFLFVQPRIIQKIFRKHFYLIRISGECCRTCESTCHSKPSHVLSIWHVDSRVRQHSPKILIR